MSDVSNALLFSIAVVSTAHMVVSVLECRLLNKFTSKKRIRKNAVQNKAASL